MPLPASPLHSTLNEHPTRVIVNPAAGGGRVRQVWPQLHQQIEQQIGAFSFAFTNGPNHATALTRRALNGPYQRIIAIGGDGTLNEVVNGFFRDGALLRPDAVLVPVACGTAGDFRRTLGRSTPLPDFRAQRLQTVDVGRITYTDATEEAAKQPAQRHFINIASFGMGGMVDAVVRDLPLKSLLGGRLAYLYAILHTLVRYRNATIELHIDGTDYGRYTIRNIAIANGRYFGGGLPIAPHASLQDGLLTIIIIKDMSRIDFIRHARRFYAGRHLELDAVSAFQGRHIEARPTSAPPVLLDVDGEPLGRLPATFEVLPQALTIQY